MSKFCSNCGKEINENADVCLECGTSVSKQSNAKKEKKKFPKWLIVVLVVLGIGIIGSAIGDDTEVEENNNSSNETSTSDNQNSNDNVSNNTTTKKEKLSLEDGHYGYSDDYGFAYYIEGYINNNTSKDYSYVQVSFTAYDSEGNTIGSCYDNNSGLKANGRWKFKAICSGEAEEVAKYELDEITGW